MNIFNNLPIEIQDIIYNQYLQKQRDYHIYQYKNRSNLLYINELKENLFNTHDCIVDNCIDSYSDIDEDTNTNEMEEDFYENSYEYFVYYYFRLNFK